jgi:hypothetical protein
VQIPGPGFHRDPQVAASLSFSCDFQNAAELAATIYGESKLQITVPFLTRLVFLVRA